MTRKWSKMSPKWLKKWLGVTKSNNFTLVYNGEPGGYHELAEFQDGRVECEFPYLNRKWLWKLVAGHTLQIQLELPGNIEW